MLPTFVLFLLLRQLVSHCQAVKMADKYNQLPFNQLNNQSVTLQVETAVAPATLSLMAGGLNTVVEP